MVVIKSIEGLSVLSFPMYFHIILRFLSIKNLLGTACFILYFFPAPGANQYTSYFLAIIAPRSATKSTLNLFSSLNFLKSLTLSLAIEISFILRFSNSEICSVSSFKCFLQWLHQFPRKKSIRTPL